MSRLGKNTFFNTSLGFIMCLRKSGKIYKKEKGNCPQKTTLTGGPQKSIPNGIPRLQKKFGSNTFLFLRLFFFSGLVSTRLSLFFWYPTTQQLHQRHLNQRHLHDARAVEHVFLYTSAPAIISSNAWAGSLCFGNIVRQMCKRGRLLAEGYSALWF